MKIATSRGTTLLTLTTILLAGLTAGCTLGSVGGAETACDQAVSHLASCGVTDLPDVGECTATKQQLAARILNQSCADVSARSSFSGSSCGSVWSIFNPSCWGDSGGSQGAGGSSIDEPAPGASPGKCYCDAKCHQYNDCCASCQQAPNPGAEEPENGSPGKCFCDAACYKYNDCCPSCPLPEVSNSNSCPSPMGTPVQKGTCIGCYMEGHIKVCMGSDQWAQADVGFGGCQHFYTTCGGTYVKEY